MHTNAAEVSFLWRWADILALGKPRLSSLVLATAALGTALAPGELPWWRHTLNLVAIGLLVASANAMNCYLERDVDALMRRTQTRPLAARRLDPRLALVLAMAVATESLVILIFSANLLTACLGVVAFVSYVWVYTPMKKWSPWALLVGAVPGALPPLMGWTAVSENLDQGALLLFAILFVWQLPHFLAISLYLREDYARAGLKMFAGTFGERVTKIAVVCTTVVLIGVSFFALPLQMTGWRYAVAAFGLGLALLGVNLYGIGSLPHTRWARAVFLSTLAYLPILFVVMWWENS